MKNSKTYSYLKDVSIKIKKHENVAIVGQIGSGKSTLIKLLMKLINQQKEIFNKWYYIYKQISREELYDNIYLCAATIFKLLNRRMKI